MMINRVFRYRVGRVAERAGNKVCKEVCLGEEEKDLIKIKDEIYYQRYTGHPMRKIGVCKQVSRKV